MKQLCMCSIVLCLSVALRAEAATATWDPNPEPGVLGYVLAYGTASGVYTTEINVGNVLSYEFFSPPGYRYYLVVRAYNGMGVGPNSNEVVLDLTTTAPDQPATAPPTVVQAEPANVAVAGDFDGDGQFDAGVYYPATGEWRLFYSSAPSALPTSIVWGERGDLPVSADYDGDRRADVAVYRPSTGFWYVLTSGGGGGGVLVLQWGDNTVRPLAFDHDGDGRADLAVLRGGVLEILLSSSWYRSSVVIN
jgi:hypothetical protein